VPDAISGSGSGDSEGRIASIHAGSRNSYRCSRCGLMPPLVNGKSGISTVFFVFCAIFIGFQRFSTTFAAICTAQSRFEMEETADPSTSRRSGWDDEKSS
jgi:hypothetical protein